MLSTTSSGLSQEKSRHEFYSLLAFLLQQIDIVSSSYLNTIMKVKGKDKVRQSNRFAPKILCET